MTISSATNRNNYIGNGSVSSYDYTFRILADSDLVVTVRSAAGVETTLVLNTDYTVSGATDEGGGSISLIDADQAWLTGANLTSGYTISIRRVRPLTQTTDIRNQGSFFPETHEDAFDHGVMLAQQQQDEIDRSIKLPESEESSDAATFIPSVASRAGKFFSWDDDGDIAAVSVVDVGELTVSAFIETLLDDVDAETARTTLGFSFTDTMSASNPVATAQFVQLHSLLNGG